MSHKDSDDDATRFHVEISIDEHDERTQAKAKLHWRGEKLVGLGSARLNPADHNVTEIGDELAVARALSQLANQLFAAAASDIEAVTHEPVTTLH